MAEQPVTRSGRRKAARPPRRFPKGLGIAIAVVVVVIGVVIFILVPRSHDDAAPAPTPSIAAGLEVRPVLAEASFISPSSTGAAQPSGAEIPADLRPSFDAMTACGTIVKGISTEPVLGCDETKKYLLGPTRIAQKDLASALALANSQATGWMIEVRLNDEGAKTLTTMTTELAKQKGPQQQMAVILNGQILDVVPVTAPLTKGIFQITQDYNQGRALSIAAALSSPADSGATS